MNLHEYLSCEGALTVSRLAEEIGLTGTSRNQQIWQWQHGHEGRKPSPAHCVAIEKATGGRVRRWDLRPDDWSLIWPELIGVKGAPRAIQDRKAA